MMLHKIPLFLLILLSVPFLLMAYKDSTQGSETRRVVFFGDSITAGYGLEPDFAFPALIQEKIDSLGWNALAVNAGLSGETSAGGLRRVDWILQREVDLFVLELGGNDGLRGLDPEVTRMNLQKIMDKVSDRFPSAGIILAGMEAPPNMGESYTRRFREIYRALADANEVIFIPFILEGVGGVSALNQEDGIHPTREGHEVIAELLWKSLRPELERLIYSVDDSD